MELPSFSEALRTSRNKRPQIEIERQRKLGELAFQRRLAEAPDPKTIPVVRESFEFKKQQIVQVLAIVLPAMRDIQPDLKLVTDKIHRKYKNKATEHSMGPLLVPSSRKVARADRWLERHAIPGWRLHENYKIPGSQKGDPIDWTSEKTFGLALGADGSFYRIGKSPENNILMSAEPINFGKYEKSYLSIDVDLKLLYQGLANLVAFHDLEVHEDF